jgi:hypothetical protein
MPASQARIDDTQRYAAAMPGPSGFSYEQEGDAVAIYHYGRRATVLRGRAAKSFLADLERRDPQQLMARATGNYKRGNERAGKRSPKRGDARRR